MNKKKTVIAYLQKPLKVFYVFNWEFYTDKSIAPVVSPILAILFP